MLGDFFTIGCILIYQESIKAAIPTSNRRGDVRSLPGEADHLSGRDVTGETGSAFLLQRRADDHAYNGRAQDGSQCPGTLHEFKLDASNMIILLEHDREARWLDGATAKNKTGLAGRLHVPFRVRVMRYRPSGKAFKWTPQT